MPEYTTATAVYRLAGIDSTVVSTADVDEAWIDQYLGTTFKVGGRTVTETIDGTGNNTLWLKNGAKDWIDADPVLTINTLTIDGTSVTVSEIYVYPGLSKIILKDTAEVRYFTVTKPQQVVINYTYGHTAVPRIINKITASIAAMSALIQQIGGTFDDVTAYTLPEFTVSKGEPYTNIRETVNQLQKQIDKMFKSVRPITFVG